MPSRETATGRQRLRPPGLDINSLMGSSADWLPTHYSATFPHSVALRHDKLSPPELALDIFFLALGHAHQFASCGCLDLFQLSVILEVSAFQHLVRGCFSLYNTIQWSCDHRELLLFKSCDKLRQTHRL